MSFVAVEGFSAYSRIALSLKAFPSCFIKRNSKNNQRKQAGMHASTTSLPEDTLSYATWIDDVLVVKLDYLESAYIFVREHVKLKKTLELEYSEKIKEFEVKNQVLVELRNAILNKQLDEIIRKIDFVATEIDGIANSLEKVPDKIRKKTKRIRKLTTKLVEDHIDDIRKKLRA